MYQEASRKAGEERKSLASFALKCESESRLKAMIELAKSERGIPVSPDELDKDPWLLNVANGTIDLRTGELRPHRREDYLTKMIPIDFRRDAGCPLWIAHLTKIMAGNQGMLDFLQRAYGYSLTGITDERLLFIQYGGGANGKTTTNEIASSVMGDYSFRIPSETLFVKRGGSIPNDVARLKGVRFAYCSEGERGKRLAESLIKDMTGGDTISARFLYSEFFNFQPTHKVWFATNHKPIILGTDNAIWDRIRLIPFKVRIPIEERIPKREMMDRFKEEFPGILAWMVKGCLDWQNYGLGTPDEVKEATDEYRKEMDFLADFIEACCVVSNKSSVTVTDLYNALEEWTEAKDLGTPSQKTFGTMLEERGFQKRKVSRGKDRGKHKWFGIGIKETPRK
jgi:putative DNA primase/helicase